MKIIEEPKSDGIPVDELQEGQVAVITAWSCTNYIGRIVQRYQKDLIELGAGGGWGSLFEGGCNSKKLCRVRVLPPGTKLEL